MLFQWTAIHDGQFRLLRRNPYTMPGQLSYTLETYTIGQAPPYVAVDYARESDVRDSRVTLNGRACLVSQSAAEALRRAEQHNAHCLLWVDCLCVRWNDEHESEMQRQWQGEILRHAVSVVA